jgi:hypothetical protein
VKLFPRVSASTGHSHGSNLQRDTVIRNVKDVHIWSTCYMVFLCEQPLWGWPVEAETCRRSITEQQMIMVTCAISSIKYRLVSLRHGKRITLNGGINEERQGQKVEWSGHKLIWAALSTLPQNWGKQQKTVVTARNQTGHLRHASQKRCFSQNAKCVTRFFRNITPTTGSPLGTRGVWIEVLTPNTTAQYNILLNESTN